MESKADRPIQNAAPETDACPEEKGESDTQDECQGDHCQPCKWRFVFTPQAKYRPFHLSATNRKYLSEADNFENKSLFLLGIGHEEPTKRGIKKEATSSAVDGHEDIGRPVEER